jgi:hypothetical protein
MWNLVFYSSSGRRTVHLQNGGADCWVFTPAPGRADLLVDNVVIEGEGTIVP